MNKVQTYRIEPEEEQKKKIDFDAIHTGLEKININAALKYEAKGIPSTEDERLNPGFCYYINKNLFYCKKKSETISDIADKLLLRKEYIQILNEHHDTKKENATIFLGHIDDLIEEENLSYISIIEAGGRIKPLIENGGIEKEFAEDFVEKSIHTIIFNPATAPNNTATEKLKYDPESVVEIFHTTFPGDKLNQNVSNSTIEFTLQISASVYYIITVSLDTGIGFSSAVTDDRRFVTSLDWKVGLTGEIDALIASEKLGLEIGGTLGNSQNKLNGSYESVDHFLAHFHNNMRIILDYYDYNPKEYGLDDSSEYWSKYKHELAKPYTSIRKFGGGINHELKSIAGGGGKEAEIVTIERQKQNGVDVIGTSSDYSADVDKNYLNDINGDDSIYESTIGFHFSLPFFFTMIHGSVEALGVHNDANKDNNGNYINLKFEVPFVDIDSKKIKGYVDFIHLMVKNKKEGFEGLFGSISKNIGNKEKCISKINPFYKQIENNIKSNKVKYGLDANFTHRKVIEINAVKEGSGFFDYKLQYYRIWDKVDAGVSANAKQKKVGVGFSIDYTSQNSTEEYLFDNTLSYVSTVYNQMMWESRNPSLVGELEKLLKNSKKERLQDDESRTKYDAQIEAKILALKGNNSESEFSCSHWETYKDKHIDELNSIINTFNDRFNEEWKKLKDDRDKMPKMIMGFDVWRHFGETKGIIIKNKQHEILQRTLENKFIFKIDLESFEKNILFKNYLENRIYASDYWI
ncbi:hypothetical protein MY04_4916 [Flammeovirga sp. MY04]|uniref:hypothetical protein n=1 Tax=Flammeovirga sp. MY04 TaxID=1191459 RepID=UPI00130516F9|nr:hypothetical protein [Flammeovirga sp. MY04]ANQ52251.2 hypothetical protein MY04_4916 [Flammeovirga sp. MY04]